MNIVADLHSHTIFSAHAHSTTGEMIEQANKIGLKALALTDHGPALEDSGHIWHFRTKSQIPHIVDGVMVLFGAEVNVIDAKGNLDMAEDYLKSLDWLIASIHKEILPKLTFEEATNAWLKVAENKYIDMIGHCEQAEHFFDYDLVVKKFAENNKIVELNSNSINVRPSGTANMVVLAETCKKYGCKVAINSDAHSKYNLGKFDNILKMLEEIDFPEELVVNSSMERLIKELKVHNKKCVEIY